MGCRLWVPYFRTSQWGDSAMMWQSRIAQDVSHRWLYDTRDAVTKPCAQEFFLPQVVHGTCFAEFLRAEPS